MGRIKHFCAVSAIIYNRTGRILLLSKPGAMRYQCVSGWLERETPVEGIRREIHEELGPIRFEVIDVIDAHTFWCPKNRPLISIWYLVKYISGRIQPQDDLAGYRHQWFSPGEWKQVTVVCPAQKELMEKAAYYIRQYNGRENRLSFLKKDREFSIQNNF